MTTKVENGKDERGEGEAMEREWTRKKWTRGGHGVGGRLERRHVVEDGRFRAYSAHLTRHCGEIREKERERDDFGALGELRSSWCMVFSCRLVAKFIL